MNFKNVFLKSIVLVFFIFSTTLILAQKKKPQVRTSTKASVSQTIGLTDVSITYSRPGVKKRKLWGGLVPFNKVWRTGANEATQILFSTDVKINGKNLKAGTYSFFAIPNKKEWTLIFNYVSDQWGAFTYNEAKDAVRIKIKPQKTHFNEWLFYSFDNMTIAKRGNPNSAVISLHWGKLKVSFKVETTAND